MIAFVTSHFALCVVGVLILIFLGLAVGYVVGNNVYNHNADETLNDAIRSLEYQGAVRSSIIDNVNLGVITYDSNGIVYYNRTIQDLEGFLRDGKVPENMESFLDLYEQDNQLKADYLLNIENTDSSIRVNYKTGTKIFEIRILHKLYDSNRLDIVIVDDITQLKDDERRQKDLAANVSHELKTPLTVIRASEFFINKITPDNMPEYDELKKWGARIISNAVRMQDIVQDFLTLSMCQDSVPMTIVDIGDVIRHAMSSVSEYPGREQVDITVPENMYYPLVFGSETLIMRIVINLLTNAIKYISYEGKTQPHKVDIKISAIGDRIGVEVADNGMGISEENIGYLFERFFRVENSGSRETGGTGIGLSIVKDIVDMHEGTISVTSQPGYGSSFTVMLPLAAAVFENVYEDAKTGIVSAKSYFRNAADFIGVQAVEAVRSMGYEDAMEAADEYEATPSGQKSIRDMRFIELLKIFGDERYTDLVDELTFIDPDVLDGIGDAREEDEPGCGREEVLPIEKDTSEEITTEGDESSDAPPESAEPAETEEERRIREDRERREEAKAILTRQILPRAVPGNSDSSHMTAKQAVTVHPEPADPASAAPKRKKRKGSLFLDLTPSSEDNNETEIKSAVRQVLDESEGK